MPSIGLHKKLPPLIATLLMAGLLWSRALLSLAEGAALVYGLVTLYKEKKSWFSKLTLWSLCLLALFFGGVYQPHSFNKESFDYLLTLCVYPAAAFFALSLSSRQRREVLLVWIVAVFISLLYPLGWYVSHINEAHHRYESGQSLPTFMDDHVRYGLFLCSGFLILLYQQLFNKRTQTIVTVVLATIIVILSVRTAWVALFLLLLIYIVGKLRWYAVAGSIVSFALLAVAAYKTIPTIQQKINYTRYDWGSYAADKYSPDFSDGTRRTINKIAWEIISTKQQSNLGWSRVPVVLNTELTHRYPTAEIKYGWPFNQYLFWWLGAGFIGMCCFIAWLFLPALYSLRNKAVVSWTLVIATTCLVESTLNMQYGVFLHAFIIAFFFMSQKKLE